MDNDLTDAELDQIELLASEALTAPWQAFVEGRDHDSGDSFIRTGGLDDAAPDVYVSLSYWNDEPPKGASAPLLDFIATSRESVPRMVRELRRLRRAAAGSDFGERSDEPWAVWRTMVRARDPKKVDRIASRLVVALGPTAEVMDTQPYWKDDTLTEVRLRTKPNGNGLDRAVVDTLSAAQGISHRWSTSGPQRYSGDRWEFEAGALGGFPVVGTTWAVVRVANFGGDTEADQ